MMNNRQTAANPGVDPMVDPHAQEWERNYAMGMHLSLLACHMLLPLVPAVVMYLIKKDESPFVKDHGREAINFQISILLYVGLGLLTFWMCGLGIVVWTAAYALAIVGMILAAVAAHSGKYYRYPACMRFLR